VKSGGANSWRSTERYRDSPIIHGAVASLIGAAATHI
jgi:hypothetical protein